MRKTVFRHLYTWVLLAIVLGTVLGLYASGIGVHLKPLGDGFIKLICMVVMPIIFTTVVIGIAGMGSFKRVGRVGLKAIVYFEIVTTIALVIGWIVVKWIQPGVGVNADPGGVEAEDRAEDNGEQHPRVQMAENCFAHDAELEHYSAR